MKPKDREYECVIKSGTHMKAKPAFPSGPYECAFAMDTVTKQKKWIVIGSIQRHGPVESFSVIAECHCEEYVREISDSLNNMKIKPNQVGPNELAVRIADALFTGGDRKRAKSLVLRLANQQDWGGWSESAATNVIAKIIEDATEKT